MRCVVYTGAGGNEVVACEERADPVCGDEEVLIHAAFAGLNGADVAQRKGAYPAPPGWPSDIPGLEVAGTIIALGPGVGSWQVGDRVCALVQGGGYAEYCASPIAQCLPVPKGLTDVQAASLPEPFFPVWSNVFDRGRLQAGETLLVQGGSSGIGVTAIQMAKALGAQVVATAGSPDKCQACLDLGADAMRGRSEVVGQLGAQPVARLQAEVGAEMQVGFGGDAATFLEDLVDALVGQVGALGQTIGRDAEGREEVLAEQFAGVDVEGLFAHGVSGNP